MEEKEEEKKESNIATVVNADSQAVNRTSFGDRLLKTAIILAFISGPVMFGFSIFYNPPPKRNNDIAIYKTISNGGALHEMFHGPNPERKKMYSDIKRCGYARGYDYYHGF